MEIQNRIDSFKKLGEIITIVLNPDTKMEVFSSEVGDICDSLNDLINDSKLLNPWFSPENVRLSLQSISTALSHENLMRWIKPYSEDLSTGILTKSSKTSLFSISDTPNI